MRDAIARAVWYGDGFGAHLARAALTPLEWVYGATSLVVGVQRARRAGRTILPTVSVGNLTVGGTGKTPVAAWVAGQLRARRLTPALLLRGYGGDESLVHSLLNPTVPVFTDGDRRRSAEVARAQGATALVLDDGFQHRQMPRDADVVLVSADLWHDGPARLLPAGPFREPLYALRRATLVLVTRKAATADRAAHVVARLRDAAIGVPITVAHLALQRLCRWAGAATEPLGALRGKRVIAASGIGSPEAFFAQLRAEGADVQAATFRDHHAFTASDAQALAASAAGAECVVCTLKDAVKLGPLWPATAAPLWYLSQSVVLESGAAAVHALLDRLASR